MNTFYLNYAEQCLVEKDVITAKKLMIMTFTFYKVKLSIEKLSKKQ